MHELTIPVPPALARGTDAITFRVHGPVRPPHATPELALACHLLPSMCRNVPLHLPRASRVEGGELMSAYAAWHPGLAPVSLTSDEGVAAPGVEAPGVAMFFSGGVDSFFTLERHGTEVDALVYVLGFDVRPEQKRLWEATRRALEAVSTATGKDLVVVETNLRTYLDDHASWEVTHGAALAAVAHLLGDTYGRMLISSSMTRDQLVAWGSRRELDEAWSSPDVSIAHVGDDTKRLEKLRALSRNDLALQHLRVCWQNPEQVYNCSECSKCVRTRLALDALGLLDNCATLRGRLTRRDLRSLDSSSRVEAFQLSEIADEYDRNPAESAPAEALRQWLREHWGRTNGPKPTAPPRAGRNDRLVVEEPRVEVDAEETRLQVVVRRGPKRATFEVQVPLGGREPSRVGDALLLWFILPAMRTATALEIEAPVSEALLERVDRAQSVWSNLREYEGHAPVPIVAPLRGEDDTPALADPGRPWACAFSCGVDSFHAALRHKERIAFLVTIHGILQERIDPDDIRVTSAWLHTGARAVGLPLVEVSMNYRAVLVGQLDCRWDYTFVMSKYGLAHFLHPHVGGLLMGGEHSYRDMQNVKPTTKYNPVLDDLASSNEVRVRLDGLTHSRMDKTREICAHPEIVDALWVCHQRYSSDYPGGRNCGQCEKCLRTLTTLRLLGADPGRDTFDQSLDVEALAAIRIPREAPTPSRRMFYRQLLAAAKSRDDLPEIRAALEKVVATFPPADPVASELADALVSRWPLLAATTARARKRHAR